MSRKLLITEYENHPFLFLFEDRALLQARPLHLMSDPAGDKTALGSIYLGKVKNVVKNLNACFVEIFPGEIGYLSTKFTDHTPVLTNRRFDGRVVEGDEILVQITSQPIKTKQLTLSTKVSLQNDYFVFSLGDTHVNYSNKLSSSCKKSIAEIINTNPQIDDHGCICLQNGQEPFGAIIRTSCQELPSNSLNEAFNAFYGHFTTMLHDCRHRTCYSMIEKPYFSFRSLTEGIQLSDVSEIVTDLPQVFAMLQQMLASDSRTFSLKLYEDALLPLAKLYSVESRMEEALGKKVWMRSGAYLVIEQTEALTAIDVNTGKNIHSVKGKPSEAHEALIRQVNKEAACEVAKQLMLRNLSGIIIVDFINMASSQDQKELLNELKALTASDIHPVRIVDMTPLGLVEITRKKITPSLAEQMREIRHSGR